MSSVSVSPGSPTALPTAAMFTSPPTNSPVRLASMAAESAPMQEENSRCAPTLTATTQTQMSANERTAGLARCRMARKSRLNSKNGMARLTQASEMREAGAESGSTKESAMPPAKQSSDGPKKPSGRKRAHSR